MFDSLHYKTHESPTPLKQLSHLDESNSSLCLEKKNDSFIIEKKPLKENKDDLLNGDKQEPIQFSQNNNLDTVKNNSSGNEEKKSISFKKGLYLFILF